MALWHPNKLLWSLGSLVLIGLAAAAVASATCEGGGGTVNLKITGATFQVNEEKTLAVDNTGSLEWRVVSKGFSGSGGWSYSPSTYDCTPNPVSPGGSCTFKLKCTAAGTITYTVNVESTTGIPASKSITIQCD
jgi:hypothetical protein